MSLFLFRGVLAFDNFFFLAVLSLFFLFLFFFLVSCLSFLFLISFFLVSRLCLFYLLTKNPVLKKISLFLKLPVFLLFFFLPSILLLCFSICFWLTLSFSFCRLEDTLKEDQNLLVNVKLRWKNIYINLKVN